MSDILSEIIDSIELNRSIKLECTDIFKFIEVGYYSYCGDIAREILRTNLVVERVDDRWVNIVGSKYSINHKDLKYFKIKERKKMIEDIIDSASYGLKNGIVNNVRYEDGILKVTGKGGNHIYTSESDDLIAVKDNVDLLYADTFTIKLNKDISRVKRGAEIELNTGMKVRVFDDAFEKDNRWSVVCYNDIISGALDITSLKNAKVKQRYRIQ